MITYKQWKTLNESFVSTFGSVLTQPVVVGGVVGATGASDWSLEETKVRLRKYMLGEDAEESDDDGGDDSGESLPKKKKSKGTDTGKGGNPFGGSSKDADDDVDADTDDLDGDEEDGDLGTGGSALSGASDDLDGDDMGDEGDDDMGGDLDGGDDDMGGDLGSDDMGDDQGMGALGAGDMGGDDQGMGDLGAGDDLGGNDLGMGGGSAKGHVCHNCGHHEPDKNAKFCKMCGKGMSKFMKKYMSKDGDGCVKHPGGKNATPWLNKGSDKGEIKKGGRETAKEMFKTVKGGKKDPGRNPEKAGGKVSSKRVKNEHICSTCGTLACEIHGAPTPSADRLNKAFFKSLTGQIGSRGNKFDDGVHEDCLIDTPQVETPKQPGPGEVGYAPNSRVGFLGNM